MRAHGRCEAWGFWVVQGRELDDVDVWQDGGALALWDSSNASLSGCSVTGNRAGGVSAHVKLDAGH